MTISQAIAATGHLALTVPDAEFLGVAGRTLLYPALGTGAEGFRTLLRTSADESVLRGCLRQILIVAGAADERHLAALQTAARVGCKTLVVCAKKELLALPANDPALVQFIDPQESISVDGRPLASPLLAPARSGFDDLLRRKFPSVGSGVDQLQNVEIPARPYLFILAATAEDFSRIAGLLKRTLRSRKELSLLLVTQQPEKIDGVLQQHGLAASVIDEARPLWLDLLARSEAVLVPHSADESASLLEPAIWTLTALRSGAPVITDANPLLDPVAGTFISDDWERGLALYLGGSTAFRAADAALGQARIAELEWTHWALPPHGRHPWIWGGLPLSRSAGDKPVLVALIDLVQDLDVILPVLQALRQQDAFRLQIYVTDWLKKESPRTFETLERERFVAAVLPRREVIHGKAPPLDGVAALLTAAETSQGPHRAAHKLAKRAASAGLPAFTLQHGFENLGLTYRDAVFADVRFASSHIFTWFRPEDLPAWVAHETFSRIVPTGSPKKVSPPVASDPLPELGIWRRKIGLFENLHWHRFSEAYKRALFIDFERVAESFPDTLFLVKPHSAGQWLAKNPFYLPSRDNVRLIEPADPQWRIFTAPALIPALDAVITTPSTVAVDAARAGRPAAVIGYDLDLPLYRPLPIVTRLAHWIEFLERLTVDPEDLIVCNERFLRRNFLPYVGQHRMADIIYDTAINNRRRRA